MGKAYLPIRVDNELVDQQAKHEMESFIGPDRQHFFAKNFNNLRGFSRPDFGA